jgi:bla regulator protein BlaR1
VIDFFAMHLEPFPAWLIRTTWQAGLLILLVLLIRRVSGRWLGVRGCYWLWLLVLIRLVMPWAPPSSLSVHNLLPLLPLRGYEVLTAPGQGSLASAAVHHNSAAQTRAPADSRADGPATSPSQQQKSWPRRHGPGARSLVSTLLALVWLAGVGFLTGCIAISAIRLRRAVRRGRPVTDRRILNLLAECQHLLGTHAAVGVIMTDQIGSPALFGVLRPRLLLPREILARRGRRELRHIFLHELAHLKRGDIIVGYLVTLLHVVHWFNPLIALGFHRMRADRELACDALALSALHPDQTSAYGHTLLRQVEQLMAARWRPMLAGLSEDRARIRQRIAMISRFRRETYRLSPAMPALVGLLACTGLTDGLPAPQPVLYAPAKVVPTTHQDRHANIVRLYIRHRDTGKCLTAEGDRVVCDANAPGDAGLWEARYEEDFGNSRDQIVFFYSVARCRYLIWDPQGNVSVKGREPNDAARWAVWNNGVGGRIVPYPFANLYLRPVGQGQVKAPYGTCPEIVWDIDQVWRVKISDEPKCNPQWKRKHIPGPDWYDKQWRRWAPR